MRRTLIRSDPVLIALPATHPLAAGPDIDPAQVDPTAWISTPVDLVGLPVTRSGRDDGLDPRLAFSGDDFRTALALVAQGLGVALLPGLALTDAPAGVVARPLRGQTPRRSVYTCRLDTRTVPLPVRRLQTYLADAADEFRSPARSTGHGSSNTTER